MDKENNERFLKNINAVAILDLLGTTEATREVSFHEIHHGYNLSTIWMFALDLCRLDPKIEISGGSDTIMIVRRDFTKLLPLVIALFQICVLTRKFRTRAGIEIGNVYGVSDFHRNFHDKIKEYGVNNIIVPQYMIGDALTGAVLAEKKLKGSRMTLGNVLSRKIQEGFFSEHKDIYVNRGDTTEIKWTDPNPTKSVFKEMNKLNKYTPPTDTLIYTFKEFLRNNNDPYSKLMVDLGYEWGILKQEDN